MDILISWMFLLVRCEPNASCKQLGQPRGAGRSGARLPCLKQSAAACWASKKHLSATHCPWKNFGPGNGILIGMAYTACARPDCRFIEQWGAVLARRKRPPLVARSRRAARNSVKKRTPLLSGWSMICSLVELRKGRGAEERCKTASATRCMNLNLQSSPL